VIQPLPRSLKVHKATATTVLKSLLKKGLVAERPAAADEAHWRKRPAQDPGHRRYRLAGDRDRIR
jgi:predicted transcriptional regulator